MARRLAPLVAVGAVIVVAVVAAVAGPVQVGEPIIPFEPLDAEPTAPPTLGADEQVPEDVDVPANPFTVGLLTYTVLVGLGAIIIGIRVLIWLIGWWLSRQRVARSPHVQDPNVTMAALRDAAELAAFEAEAASPGRASDAVVACWVLLEQAAASAGTPRAAPQTPTEFTAAVLARHRADRSAVETLLALYHKARFGTALLPDEAASIAAGALRTISASLSSAAAGPTDRL
ncbi:MAG TPA: DUF4129 domain-containing protein [Jiangellaceae bacterium]